MNKIVLNLIYIVFITLTSCGYHVVLNTNKEPVINQKYFKFNQPMTIKDCTVIDTGVIYRLDHTISNNEIFNPREYDYNEYLKFYSDGTFLKIYKKEIFTPNDLIEDSNSTWRGRFILEGNEIILEQFYPRQVPEKRYDRKILKGTVVNEMLVINWDTGNLKRIYIKQSIN